PRRAARLAARAIPPGAPRVRRTRRPRHRGRLRADLARLPRPARAVLARARAALAEPGARGIALLPPRRADRRRDGDAAGLRADRLCADALDPPARWPTLRALGIGSRAGPCGGGAA